MERSRKTRAGKLAGSDGVSPVPQLWLTYTELADALDCTPTEARSAVIRKAWTRKHSSDGLTRVLMPPDAMLAYFRGVAGERTAPLRAERPLPPLAWAS